MPRTLSQVIGGAAITGTGVTSSVNPNPWRRAAINVVNGASNICTFTVEGSLNNTDWFTIAYGEGSSAAYTQTAKSVGAAAKALLQLPTDDMVLWVRINVTAANGNGTTFTLVTEEA